MSSKLLLFSLFIRPFHADISDVIPCHFVLRRPCFGLESQSGYQPLSWSLHFCLWPRRCGFHLVQNAKFFWAFQNLILVLVGDMLITLLNLYMIPKVALATVSHVYRFKQILLLTCKLFLPERLPSGATMINRQWSNNYELHSNIVDNRITLYN